MKFTQSVLTWLSELLKERYGHPIRLEEKNNCLFLKFGNLPGSIVFDQLLPVFHESRSDFTCQQWDAKKEGYSPPLDAPLPAPGIDCLPTPLIEQQDENWVVHYDILGLTYWMLSRLEEVGRIDLDEHERFPATSSHAYQHGYLERPIVDEWLQILGQVIRRIWPELELKQHQFNMKVSHDVDVPTRYGFASAKALVRSMAGDVLKRRDFKSALRAPWVRLNTRHRLHSADNLNTFDWLMDQSERHGLVSAFYFICGRTDVSKDADYEPEHPAIRDLMRRIHSRGHEIGLHPSYNTFQEPEAIAFEAERLRSVMAEEGIKQTVLGGRMHYLRWKQPTTVQGWEQAGMSYDSTLGYADMPGFRCGTCFEYPAYNPVSQKRLNVRIRPLIAMECTIISKKYMGLGNGNAALAKFTQLKNACRAVKGCFTLLWHNSNFTSDKEREIYRVLLDNKR